MAANTNTAFKSLNVKRRTEGFVRHADKGIRAQVVALVAKGGSDGVTANEIERCWNGNATPAKIRGCMGILAGDDYGYAVERLIDPTNSGLDRYRFATPEGSPKPLTVAPDATKPAANIAEVVTEPDAGKSEPDAETARINGLVDAAIASGDPKAYVKKHVDSGDRAAVRKVLSDRSAK